ncbi:MAG: serine/threonine-protein kinase [Myxococcota bacterium]
MQDEGRHYRVLGLIGSGGFGRVYRARLEAEGFTKEVAIKVMSEAEPPEDVLARFRDEARLLGLVRDRAIVAAEPPVRIGGHWAVVMEFVDGCTLGRLIAVHGPVPPSVALEIVGEVARALDKVFHHPGPNGQPLSLLHRDLKPANLQITAHGEVKILDFGVARAELDDRNAETRGMLLGTADYMAPERLQGLEVPEGDVYSLGRVLEEMLLGRRRTAGEPRTEPKDAEDPGLRAALQLANEMTRLDPDMRPKIRDVEHRCEVLLAATGRNPSLRSWAERAVPEVAVQHTEDALVGEVLTERTSAGRKRMLLGDDDDDVPPSPSVPPAPERAVSPLGLFGMFGVFGGVLVVVAGLSLVAGMVVAALTAVVYLRSSDEEVVASAPEEPAPVTQGFQTVGEHAEPPPSDAVAPLHAPVPGMEPPSDDTGRPVVLSGKRADVLMGQGRAGVLEIGMRPAEIRVSRGMEVVPTPPYLVLGAMVPGRGTLTVSFEGGGEREWVYDVSRTTSLDADGGPDLITGSDHLEVPAGIGIVCTADVAPRTAILIDESRARLEPMGPRGYFLSVDEGTVDVVFDIEGRAPRVLTLEAHGADPATGELSPPDPEVVAAAAEVGCVMPPPELVRIPIGGELVLPVGREIDHLVVGDADHFEVLRSESDPKKIRVRALRAGQTAVAVTDTNGADPWVRWVIAE